MKQAPTTDEHEGSHSDWPIFVISLKDAASRRAAISKQLHDLGLDFEFFDAIDGRVELSSSYDTRIDRAGTIAYFGRPMTDAEYACALSHLHLYERLVEEDLPGAIILEDDAIAGNDFKSFVQRRCYDRGNLIQMDHQNARVFRWSKADDLFGRTTLMKLASNAFLCTGYSISKKGAAYILQNALPLRAPADWPCDLIPLSPMCTSPKVVDHPAAPGWTSTLETERADLERGNRENRLMRFAKGKYWRNKAFKILTRRLS